MTSVSIRAARESDADDVTQLTAQLGYTVEAEVLRERLSRILGRSDQRFLVAEVGGQTVGWLHAVIAEFVEAERSVVIAGLVVSASHRRHGIGRVLMERAEGWAREQGCSVVRLWSSSTRTETHRFYAAMGYTNIKTQHSFAKSLDPDRRDAVDTFVPRVE
jgi:N-acetylglutamate synthase-like GNAT family acetyltransferase